MYGVSLRYILINKLSGGCSSMITGQLDAHALQRNNDDLGESSHIQQTPVTLVLPEPLISIRLVSP